MVTLYTWVKEYHNFQQPHQLSSSLTFLCSNHPQEMRQSSFSINQSVHDYLRSSTIPSSFLSRVTFIYYFALSTWEVLEFLLWFKRNFLKNQFWFHSHALYVLLAMILPDLLPGFQQEARWEGSTSHQMFLSAFGMGVVQATTSPFVLSPSFTCSSQQYNTPCFSLYGIGLFPPDRCIGKGSAGGETSEHWKLQPLDPSFTSSLSCFTMKMSGFEYQPKHFLL